jgi:Sulfotransferase domain
MVQWQHSRLWICESRFESSSPSLERIISRVWCSHEMTDQFITIVSGLPRSGTSMMMQMLDAAGIPIVKDDIRTPDDDNPRGYYEFERVKQIEHDQEWLEDAQGKAVKMISALLNHLPARYNYRIIFMRREMGEILASQKVMLARRQQDTDKVGDEKMAQFFDVHLRQIQAWLATQPNIQVLYVHYGEMMADPRGQAARINQFLGGKLDVEKMSSVVDHQLYRERRDRPPATQSA